MRQWLLAMICAVGCLASPSATDCAGCHEVDLARFEASVHAGMGCVGCHSSITTLPHVGKPAPVLCATCHEGPSKAYSNSVHGLARKSGMGDAATCASCHGPIHEIRPSSDPASKVNKKNLPGTCGACHSNPEFLAHHKIPFAKPVEAYRLSVHGRAVARGNDSAASCSDCHGSHDILASSDPKAKVNRAKVKDTCGVCHPDVATVYAGSVHGIAVAKGSKDAPTCTGCHGEHNILAPSEAASMVNAARVSTVTCGRCHGDERLNARYGFGEKVTAFQDSYHGLAIRGGQPLAANCASCHGVHNILPSSDPRSSISPANLQQTCGQCHAGVGKRFIGGKVHTRTAGMGEHQVVRWIRWSYYLLIPLTIGFMLFHNGIDWLSKVRRRKPHHGTGEQVPRMNRWFRLTHGLVIVSFLTLVVTGFALKYPDAGWVTALQIDHFGHGRGVVHRIAAVVIMVATGLHGLHLLLAHDRLKVREILLNNLDVLLLEKEVLL